MPALAPFLARLTGVAFVSFGLLGPRLRFGVGVATSVAAVSLMTLPVTSDLEAEVAFLARLFLGVSAVGDFSVSASAPSVSADSVLIALARFLGAATVGVASSLSSPSPLAAPLPFDFLGEEAEEAASRVAPFRSFFLRLSQEELADLALAKPARPASFSVSI